MGGETERLENKERFRKLFSAHIANVANNSRDHSRAAVNTLKFRPANDGCLSNRAPNPKPGLYLQLQRKSKSLTKQNYIIYRTGPRETEKNKETRVGVYFNNLSKRLESQEGKRFTACRRHRLISEHSPIRRTIPKHVWWLKFEELLMTDLEKTGPLKSHSGTFFVFLSFIFFLGCGSDCIRFYNF